MSQAGRKKPDKWRNLQRAAEQEMEAKRTQVAQLQEVNVRGVSAAFSCSASRSKQHTPPHPT